MPLSIGIGLSLGLNGKSGTPDTTAPTLSSATDVKTGITTADVGVDTNEANGTLYVVVTTSSTSPTAAQVKLGQDNSGAAATYASSQAISSTGTKSFSATGLTGSTAYTAHFMHEDASGNQSTVVKGDGFTTDSATTTWNSADKAASITLSGGDLTATKASSDSTFSNVRSIGSRSTGKYYVEFTGTFSSNSTEIQCGIATASASLINPNYLGINTQSLGVDYAGGTLINNVGLGSVLSVATGHVRCLAIDLDNMKFWGRSDGGNWCNGAIGVQNPATNTGGYSLSTLAAGPYYLVAGVYRTSNHVIVLNCGGSAYAFTPPSGFGNW